MSGCDVYLLCTKSSSFVHSSCKQVEIDSFYKPINLGSNGISEKFRNGFWIKTTERFFILYDFVNSQGITSFFHAELDNLIFDLSALPLKLNSLGSGIFLPRDSRTRCIASLVYVNDNSVLKNFCVFAINGISIYQNDMLLLGEFSRSNSSVYFLPNELSFTENNGLEFISFIQTDGIFDAAAIGQYLFGIDPRNTLFPVYNCFVNENSNIGALRQPYRISIERRESLMNGWNLYNIHVHSKVFHKLVDESWLNAVIKRLNLGRKSYIIATWPWT